MIRLKNKLSVLLVGAIFVGAAGCGGGEEAPSPTSVSSNSQETPVQSAEPSKPSEVKTYLESLPSDPQFAVKKDEKGAASLYLLKNGQEILICPLVQVKAETKLYHWTDEGQFNKYSAEGSISPASLDALVNSTTDNAQGGGYYVSTSAFDSQLYGNRLLMVVPKTDLLLVPIYTFRKHYPDWTPEDEATAYTAGKRPMEKLNSINRGLRKAGIHGSVQPSFGLNDLQAMGWFNLIHPQATEVVVGSNHPWMQGTVEEFTAMIRGQKLSTTDKEKLQPQLIAILTEIFVTADQKPPQGDDSEKIYRNAANQFREELIAILQTIYGLKADALANPVTPTEISDRIEFDSVLKRLRIAEEEVLSPTME